MLKPKIGSIGVCLADTGQPIKLYAIGSVFSDGHLQLFSVNKSDPNYDKPRIVESSDFWVLVDSI
jgi:hypothetical protein